MSTEVNDSNSDLSTSLDNGTGIRDNNQEQLEKVTAIDETAQNPDALTAKSQTVSQENDLPEEVIKISSDSAEYDDISVNAQTDDSANVSISQENRLKTFADEDNLKKPEDVTAKDLVQMESNTNPQTQARSAQLYSLGDFKTLDDIVRAFNEILAQISENFYKAFFWQ